MLHGFQVVGYSMIYVHTHRGQYVANHVRYKVNKGFNIDKTMGLQVFILIDCIP